MANNTYTHEQNKAVLEFCLLPYFLEYFQYYRDFYKNKTDELKLLKNKTIVALSNEHGGKTLLVSIETLIEQYSRNTADDSAKNILNSYVGNIPGIIRSLNFQSNGIRDLIVEISRSNARPDCDFLDNYQILAENNMKLRPWQKILYVCNPLRHFLRIILSVSPNEATELLELIKDTILMIGIDSDQTPIKAIEKHISRIKEKKIDNQHYSLYHFALTSAILYKIALKTLLEKYKDIFTEFHGLNTFAEECIISLIECIFYQIAKNEKTDTSFNEVLTTNILKAFRENISENQDYPVNNYNQDYSEICSELQDALRDLF